MSFLKNLTKEFDNLKAKFSDDDKKPEGQSEAQRGESDAFYGHQQQQQQQSQGYPPQQSSYGSGAPQAPYGQYPQGPPQQQQYSQPSYGAPPPAAGPPGAPQCPPGWHTQFDPASQRWYFVEHATGRTTWDTPSQSQTTDYRAAPPPPGNAGLSYPPYGGQMQHGMQEYPDGEKEKKKKKDHSLLYGAGGLAAGALVGGVIAHEMSKSCPVNLLTCVLLLP